MVYSLLSVLHDPVDLVRGADDQASDLPSKLVCGGHGGKGARINDTLAVFEENEGVGAGGSCISSGQRPAVKDGAQTEHGDGEGERVAAPQLELRSCPAFNFKPRSDSLDR